MSVPSIIPGTPGYDPKLDPNNGYGYVPTEGLGIAFVVLFSLSTILHLGQGFLSRRPWLMTLVAGGLGEVLGWSGRLWGSFSPDNYDAFMIQIVCLVICPAFLSAAVYALLGWIIVDLDPSLSLIKPRLYWRIFISADVLSLVIQSGGGGIAASSNDDPSTSKLGSNIMLAGIIFQFITTSVFAGLFLHFVWGVRKHDVRPSPRTQYLLAANLFATAMIIVRGIYRIAELSQGWNGYLIQHEPWFMFDAIPMLLLLVVLNAAHPCWTLPRPEKWGRTSYAQDKDAMAAKTSESGVKLTQTESA